MCLQVPEEVRTRHMNLFFRFFPSWIQLVPVSFKLAFRELHQTIPNLRLNNSLGSLLDLQMFFSHLCLVCVLLDLHSTQFSHWLVPGCYLVSVPKCQSLLDSRPVF